MLEIMQQLLDELQFIPMPLVDCLLAQFEKKRKHSHPAAFKLACDLCAVSADKLQRYVCQYFSDIIVASSRELEESDLLEFKEAHKLVLEINRTVPLLLLNVVPQLEEELKVEHLVIRQFATATLGELFLESGAQIVNLYSSAWQTWKDRYLSAYKGGMTCRRRSD